MLIKALCDYADAQDSRDALPKGYAKQDIHYRIQLSPDGEVIGITDVKLTDTVRDKKGREKPVQKPRSIELPVRTQKPGIESNYIEHRPLYIFGLNYNDGVFTPDDSTNKARKSHEAFVKHELEFLEGLDSDICNAYRNFLLNWQPENECENPFLKNLGKEYKSAYFGFWFGMGQAALEEDEQYKAKYTAIYNEKAAESDAAEKAVCSILGEKLPIARLHDKIKFPGGQPSGCQFVCMNDNAYESYGKVQSFNSGVSEAAMKKYTAMFNKLLSDKAHHTKINDMVIIYFAIKSNDSAECGLFSSLMYDNHDDNTDGETEQAIDMRMKNAAQGLAADEKTVSAIETDPDCTFYIAGFTPNSSRICQKFIYRDSFGSIMSNMMKHQRDMKINEKSSRKIYFSTIGRELISPKSTKEVPPPSLMADIMLAAFNGTKYPDGLLAAVVNRIKTDSDEEKNHFIKINDVRAGILKACINRKYNKEVITMSWDKENKNAGYICGGVFAIYEKIQKDSAGGDLNRTIKDAFFSAACSRPASVFAKLTMLSNNHMRKLDDAACVWYNKLIQETLDNIEGGIPLTLSVEDQAQFCLGYHLMNERLYTKSDRKD